MVTLTNFKKSESYITKLPLIKLPSMKTFTALFISSNAPPSIILEEMSKHRMVSKELAFGAGSVSTTKWLTLIVTNVSQQTLKKFKI